MARFGEALMNPITEQSWGCSWADEPCQNEEYRGGKMTDKDRFVDFFKEFGISCTTVTLEEVVLEMEDDVAWDNALSVGQVWFLFDAKDEFLGVLNDETMEFEARGSV